MILSNNKCARYSLVSLDILSKGVSTLHLGVCLIMYQDRMLGLNVDIVLTSLFHLYHIPVLVDCPKVGYAFGCSADHVVGRCFHRQA